MKLSDLKNKLAKSFQFKKMKQLIKFVKDVANDDRIPANDKKILLTLLALIISPLDLIPDWIPVIGQLDDILMMALILDYLFEVLDQDILLSHYPWDMKSFLNLKRMSSWISMLAPAFIKKRLWSYTKT